MPWLMVRMLTWTFDETSRKKFTWCIAWCLFFFKTNYYFSSLLQQTVQNGFMDNTHNTRWTYIDLSVGSIPYTTYNKLCNRLWCQSTLGVDYTIAVEFDIASNDSNLLLRKTQLTPALPPRSETTKVSYCEWVTNILTDSTSISNNNMRQ